MMNILFGRTVILLALIIVLALGLIRSVNRIDMLEQRMNYEVSKISDDFLQENDYYPDLDKVYSHLESIQQRLERLERVGDSKE